MTWETPPPPRVGGRRKPEYDKITNLLQKNAGHWAKVAINAPSPSISQALWRRGCETRVISHVAKQYDVYARWPIQ